MDLQVSNKPYYPALNGLRAVAILMVFTQHYKFLLGFDSSALPLWTGVDIFFVLSGFLITMILMRSLDDPHYFRNFYIRRALRIFPLYYGFFILLAVSAPILHLTYSRSVWTNVLYVSNLFRSHPAITNPTVLTPHLLGVFPFQITLGHLWSLCVEEQFYLLWPLAVWLGGTRRSIMQVCFWGVVATVSLRTLLYLHDPAGVAANHYLYFLTYTRCDGLLIGAGVAAWLQGEGLSARTYRTAAYLLLTAPLLLLVGGYLIFGRAFPSDEVNPVYCTLGYTLIGMSAAGVLLIALDESSVLCGILRHPRLSALGAISYGLYFFHNIPLGFVQALYKHSLARRHLGLPTALVCFALTYGVSQLSFTYFESPFIRLKRYFEPTDYRLEPLYKQHNIGEVSYSQPSYTIAEALSATESTSIGSLLDG